LRPKHRDTTLTTDPDWIQDAGEEAATNRELEVILGSRAKGLVLPERGPGIVTLANVLGNFIHFMAQMI
jgi:hypothetical protein